jgi:hypothetical protein
VSRIASSGLFLSGVAAGCNGGKEANCARMSGEALMRNQWLSSPLIATLD